MIKYIKRKDIDVEKYDDCIENSIQSRVYAFSWYLDIVADNWGILVLDNYQAVMPLPWRKKYGIKYVYTPLRILELGVFSKKEVDEDHFLKILFKKFKYVNLRMNCNNKFSQFEHDRQEMHQQYLSLKSEYSEIVKNYRSDRKKDLKRAKKHELREKWNDSEFHLVDLFKNNVAKRFKQIKDKDYDIIIKLITVCVSKKVGEVFSIYDSENNLVASSFLIKHKGVVTILLSSTDLKNRKNGANTFLIDRAIFKYNKELDLFSFGGSSMKNIASYFNSFGAYTEKYSALNSNKLPLILKFFKK